MLFIAVLMVGIVCQHFTIHQLRKLLDPTSIQSMNAKEANRLANRTLSKVAGAGHSEKLSEDEAFRLSNGIGVIGHFADLKAKEDIGLYGASIAGPAGVVSNYSRAKKPTLLKPDTSIETGKQRIVKLWVDS